MRRVILQCDIPILLIGNRGPPPVPRLLLLRRVPMTPVALKPANSSPSQSSSESIRQAHLAELALAVGGFGIGTGEFGIMGLLPDVARDIGVSIPEAGHIISAYALGVVVGAPVIAVLAARLSRRM